MTETLEAYGLVLQILAGLAAKSSGAGKTRVSRGRLGSGSMHDSHGCDQTAGLVQEYKAGHWPSGKSKSLARNGCSDGKFQARELGALEWELGPPPHVPSTVRAYDALRNLRFGHAMLVLPRGQDDQMQIGFLHWHDPLPPPLIRPLN